MDEKNRRKAEASLEKRQKKLKYSELMDAMRDEFGSMPEVRE